MNEIDELMDIDPTEMSAKDINAIIAYMREQRATFEKGIKPKKAEGPKKTATLASLGFKVAPTEPTVSLKRKW